MVYIKNLAVGLFDAELLASASLVPAFASPVDALTSAAVSAESLPQICFTYMFWKDCI